MTGDWFGDWQGEWLGRASGSPVGEVLEAALVASGSSQAVFGAEVSRRFANQTVFFTTADDIRRIRRREYARWLEQDIDDETVCLLAAAVL